MNCRNAGRYENLVEKKMFLISFFSLEAIGLVKNLCKITTKSTFQVILPPLNLNALSEKLCLVELSIATLEID